MPVKDANGRLQRWIGTSMDIDDQKSALIRLEQMQKISSELSRVVGLREVGETILRSGTEALEAASGVMALLNEETKTIRIHSHRGFSDEAADRWGDIPLNAKLPIAKCISTGEPLFFEKPEWIFEAFGEVEERYAACFKRSLAVLPLEVDGQVIGGLAFGFDGAQQFVQETRSFLRTIASQCAQAVARALLFERERSARRLAERERARIHSILQNIPTSIAITRGPEHVLEFLNRAYMESTQGRDFVGLRLKDAHPELEQQGVFKIADDVYATGVPFHDGEREMFIYDPNGEKYVRYFNVNILPWKDEKNELSGLLSCTFDVTDQVMARRKVEVSEARLSLALEAANLGLWEMSLETGKVWRGGGHDRIFGIEQGSYWDFDTFISMVHPDDREKINTVIELSLQHDNNFAIDFRIRRPDGALRWIHERGMVKRDSQGRAIAFLGVALDITRLKEAEVELKQAKEEADFANKAKTKFVASMSHEFRTPLTAILGFAEFLGRPNLPAEKRDAFVDGIHRNGQALVQLIDDILDLAKIEAGKIDVSISPFDPRMVVNDVISTVSREADAKKLQIDSLVSLRVPIKIDSDPLRLRQILVNLVSNAVKFTESGFVSVTVDVDSNGRIVFEVKDSGVGIAENMKDRLFHPFTRDEKSRIKQRGTGLGLSISKRLANELGGDLVLKESRPEQGSTFQLTILNYGQVDQLSALDGMRILVVEDTPDVRDLMEAALQRAGALVDTAVDGADGVDKLKKNQYDVVLMDLRMPNKDGYQAVQEMRQFGYRGPVIAVTAQLQIEDRSKCIAAGFSDCIIKPVRPTELVRMLATRREDVASL